MLLPVTLATFMSPPVYSVPSIVTSQDYSVEIYEATSTEAVNPEPVGGTREIQVSSSTQSVVLREELKAVCSCESGNGAFGEPQQYHADGSVIRGIVNPHDIGMCQINTDYWLATAEVLNFDIFTEAGNISMANHIYDSHGLAPWSASKACWQHAL